MKLRLDPDKISFRLDLPELDLLLERGELLENLHLPDRTLTYRIIAQPEGTEAGFSSEPNLWVLSLPRDKLIAHKTELPSLTGIVTQFTTAQNTTLHVALEVNLKKKLKRRLES